jgi:hypothetical protein
MELFSYAEPDQASYLRTDVFVVGIAEAVVPTVIVLHVCSMYKHRDKEQTNHEPKN